MASRREVIGMYVDMTQGYQPADSRLFVVERTRGGKIVVTAEGDPAVSAVLNHMTAEEWAGVLEAIDTRRERVA